MKQISIRERLQAEVLKLQVTLRLQSLRQKRKIELLQQIGVQDPVVYKITEILNKRLAVIRWELSLENLDPEYLSIEGVQE
jgi:hypothetical protein